MRRTESCLSRVTEEIELSSRSHRREESGTITSSIGANMQPSHRQDKSSASASSIGSTLSSLRKKFSTESLRKLSRPSPLGTSDGNTRGHVSYTGDGRKTKVASGVAFAHQSASIEDCAPNPNHNSPSDQYTSSRPSNSVPLSTGYYADFKKQTPSNSYESDPRDAIQYTARRYQASPSRPPLTSLPTPPRAVALPPSLSHNSLPEPVGNKPSSFFPNTLSHDGLPKSMSSTPSFNSLFNTNIPINERSPAQSQQQKLKKSTSFPTLKKSSSLSSLLYDTHPPATPLPAFELVALSGLMAQSYRDIKVLRAIHQAQDLRKASAANAAGKGLDPISESDNEDNFLTSQSSRMGQRSSVSASGKREVLPKSSGGGFGRGLAKMMSMGNLREDVVDVTLQESAKIDFDQIERNLKAFEGLYKTWVKCGDEDIDEVHLVAMVAREGDLVRSVKKTGGVKAADVPAVVVTNANVRREKTAWADCGM